MRINLEAILIIFLNIMAEEEEVEVVIVDKEEINNFNTAYQTITTKYVKRKVEKIETQILNTTTTPETVINTIEQEVDEEGDLRGGLMVVNTIELEVDEEGDLIKIDES